MVLFGPCADLLAEVFEEVLETREDGLNVVLVRAAAAFLRSAKTFSSVSRAICKGISYRTR